MEGLEHCERFGHKSPSVTPHTSSSGVPDCYSRPPPLEGGHAPCLSLCLLVSVHLDVCPDQTSCRVPLLPPLPSANAASYLPRVGGCPPPSDSSVFCLVSWILTSLPAGPWPCQPRVGWFSSGSIFRFSWSPALHWHVGPEGVLMVCPGSRGCNSF